MSQAGLDFLFSALSDPTRRRILELLAEHEPLTTTELSVRFPVTRWAVMKHLEALRAARLIQTMPRGRRRLHFLDRQWFGMAQGWLDRVRRSGLEAEPSKR